MKFTPEAGKNLKCRQCERLKKVCRRYVKIISIKRTQLESDRAAYNFYKRLFWKYSKLSSEEIHAIIDREWAAFEQTEEGKRISPPFKYHIANISRQMSTPDKIG